MSFRPPPATACWQHLEARSGFEVAYFQGLADGWAVVLDYPGIARRAG